MNELPRQLCVRFMPGVYGMEDLPPGATLPEAKRRLQSYVDRGLRCCVLFDDHALYFESDGEVVKGPLPYGGFQIPLRNERR